MRSAVFGAVRPRLFGIAYRMLGSVGRGRGPGAGGLAALAGAPTAARCTTRPRSWRRRPPGWRSTPAQSARARRETYIGPWLPEPVDTSADPYLGAERGEALEFAVLLLLEKLTPHERAAYVLREAFDYPYPQIADDPPVERGRSAAAGQPGPQAPRRRAARRRCRPTAAAPAADGVRRRRAHRRPRRAGEAVRGRRGQLLRRRRRASGSPASRSSARSGWRSTSRRSPRGTGRVWTWSGRRRTGRPARSASRRHGVRRGHGQRLGGGIDQVLWMMNPDKIASFAAP